jgi:large subunit ribosomal protein L4
MAKISVLNTKGEKVKDIKLNDEVWTIEPNDAVIYDAIILSRNSLRQGTHSTKTRSEVRGGGRKPWKQKGTGNARQGSTRSPQWPGGGIVFGPHPRSYAIKMNRKERRLALKSALSYKVSGKELLVVDNFNIENSKTKDAKLILEALKANGKTLVVVKELNENIILATRNLNNVILLQADEVNTLDVISSDIMIIEESAVKVVEEALK